MEDLNEIALRHLREYLQIPSVHPDVDYTDCVKFLKSLAVDLGLPAQVINVKSNKPIVIITWEGTKPHLQSILLNSHMDVVPVYEEKWTYKPFDAELTDGKIYARGSQDMKSVGIIYLEAIRRLKLKGITCSRNIHVCFVPDEEIGGMEGMKLFVQTKEFKDLNVGASLDESYASGTNELILFYAEKTTWQLTITCKGQTGHGSLLLDNTPGEKVTYLMNKFNEFRNTQKKILEKNSNLSYGDVTTVNCTQISGGVQCNVIPSEISISFDCRLAYEVSTAQFEDMINRWCKEAGSDCTIRYHQKDPKVVATKLDESNVFWLAFKKALDGLGVPFKSLVCFGSTDSRYLREVGVSAFGCTPIRNTEPRLHDHNEYVGVDEFFEGIDICFALIPSLANA